MAGATPAVEPNREGPGLQLVVFALGEEELALPMSAVREIVRMLPLAPVPRAPAYLLGLANLRGRVLPVLDLRRLMGAEPRAPSACTRVLVLEHRGSRLGLMVDAVRRVLEADASSVEPAREQARALGASTLESVVRTEGAVVQVLALDALLADDFQETARGAGSGPTLEAVSDEEGPAGATGAEEDEGAQLVAFRVGGQELALPVGEVREIVRLPEHLEAVPGAGPHALGLMPLRGSTLPLVSLAALLGLPASPPADGARVLVTALPVGGRRLTVGLVVDGVHEVLRVPEASREAVPALLARGGGLAEVGQLCRLEGGRRLVAVLEPHRLGAMGGLAEVATTSAVEAEMETESLVPEAAETEDDVQLVVFQLDGEEYGLPVEAVQEITRVPERLSRVPRTPAWIEGLVNLRGAVLPVLDMRARFGLPRGERTERQRILVLDLGGTRTGFVTDSVTEVLAVPRAQVEAAPRLSEDQARLMGRVVNLAESGRMIVLLDPQALVDDDERAALAGSGCGEA